MRIIASLDFISNVKYMIHFIYHEFSSFVIILCIILFLASNTAVGCPEHNNRPLEFYDTDDGQPVCSHCVVTGERQTHLIVPIDDIVSAVLIQTCSKGSIVWQSCRYGSCHNIFITWQ